MTTYWQATTRNNESHYCVMTSGHDAATAISKAIIEAIYMQAQHPEYHVSIADIAEYCESCYNTGKVLKRHKQIRCPECRGKVPTGKIADIAFTMPDPANRISLVAA